MEKFEIITIRQLPPTCVAWLKKQGNPEKISQAVIISAWLKNKHSGLKNLKKLPTSFFL